MNYTLNQLRVFLKVTETRSITRAAEELHMTQPAVSIQLKNFQDQFEIPLIEVIKKRIYITDFGHEVAASAERILGEVNDLKYKAKAHNGFLSGKLKLSVVSTGKYVIPYFIADFLKQNQGVELALDVSNRTKVVESISKNEIDFALVSLMPENLKLNSIRLLENKLFLVGNSEYNEKQIKSSSFWENNPIIFREDGSATRLMMETYLINRRINVKRRLELTSNEAVKQAVIAGIGCSIMPLIGLKNEVDKNQIQILKTKELPVITNWELVWLEEKKLSPVADAFIRFIEIEKERIIHEHFNWYLNY